MSSQATVTPEGGGVRLKFWRRALGALDDRINPILVKEVRQSLRGKYFGIIFALTLTIATCIGSVLLVSEAEYPSSSSGKTFFQMIFGCFVFAICLFVPFAAFFSLASEWDEDTHDMLVISNLRPWQIVRGKFMGAFFQTLLYGSALIPFLSFAFLLRGLDLVGAVWATLIAVVTSGGLISVSLALSSSSQKKFVRITLMAFMAIFLSWVSAGLTTIVGFAFLGSGVHRTPEGVATILAYISLVIVVSGFALASTTARLTHPEENRSSALRILGTSTLVVGLAWGAWFYSQGPSNEFLGALGVIGAIWITVTSLNFMCEEERLGRRVQLDVPRNRYLGIAVAAWYPGGGRAALHFMGQGLLLLLGLSLIPAFLSPIGSARTSPDSRAVFGALTLLSYGFIYVGLPTALLSRWTREASWRAAGRIAAIVLFFGGLFGPMIFDLLVNGHSPGNLNHLGNPQWVIDRFVFRKEGAEMLYVVWAVAAAVLCLNIPRIATGIREMTAASEHRRGTETRTRIHDEGQLRAEALQADKQSEEHAPQS